MSRMRHQNYPRSPKRAGQSAPGRQERRRRQSDAREAYLLAKYALVLLGLITALFSAPPLVPLLLQ